MSFLKFSRICNGMDYGLEPRAVAMGSLNWAEFNIYSKNYLVNFELDPVATAAGSSTFFTAHFAARSKAEIWYAFCQRSHRCHILYENKTAGVERCSPQALEAECFTSLNRTHSGPFVV